MPAPIIPLTVLLLGGYLLGEGNRSSGTPAKLDQGAQDSLFELRTMPDGTVIRFYRPDKVPPILDSMSKFGLEIVTGGPLGPNDGAMFKLVSLGDPNASALQAILTAKGAGLVVLGSMNLPFSNGGDRFLIFSPVAKRNLANQASQLAVFQDSQVEPVAKQTPADDPLATLPPEIRAEVAAILSDPNADPDALDKEADVLDAGGFHAAATLLRARAATLRLQRDLKDQKAGGTPFTLRGANGLVAASDLPFALANFYTSDGGRWKEILPINSGMTVKNDPNVGTIPTPWKIGQVVLLPLSWGVRKKGIPAMGSTTAHTSPANGSAAPADANFGPVNPDIPGADVQNPGGPPDAS